VPTFRPGFVPGEGTGVQGGVLHLGADSTLQGLIIYVYRNSGELVDSTFLEGRWSARNDRVRLIYHTCGVLWCPADPDSADAMVDGTVMRVPVMLGVSEHGVTFERARGR
jgi:hypothetical protein